MKRLTAIILCAILLAGMASGLSLAAPMPIADGGPEISSAAAVVMDINTGAVLYAKNQEKAIQPSSLTKLMTAYVVMNELSLRSTVTCSQEAATQDFPTAANVGFAVNESYSVSDALKGMLMASAEDCAYSLAEKAGGSMESFSQKMNEYADRLGLINSHFVNSMGLFADGHYSCAYDMARVAALLMKEQAPVKSILSLKSASLAPTNFSSGREISSSHRFIAGTDSYQYCYAGKTGGSAHGGDGSWALCTYAASGSLNLVCIVMGARENSDTYEDTKLLFDYAFNTYESLPISSRFESGEMELGQMFAECPLFDKLDSVSVYIDPAASLILPKHYDPDLVSTSIDYEQLNDFVYGENVIGRISLFYGERVAGEADIIYYTENASLSALAFARSFPSFLINPDMQTGSMERGGELITVGDDSFFNRMKNRLLSLYTPAKTMSLLVGVTLAILGALIIMLTFPMKGSSKTEGLYSKEYEYKEDEDDLYD